MFLCVTTDVWTHFHDVLLPKFSQQLNGVNVMSGPIFDEDFDGHVDAFKRISGYVRNSLVRQLLRAAPSNSLCLLMLEISGPGNWKLFRTATNH